MGGAIQNEPGSTPQTVQIVGASARAAAGSAARAGFAVRACDLYADRDLQLAASSACRCAPYPEAVPTFLAEQPDTPWLYTGALENAPKIVDEGATRAPCWGVTGAALRRIRSPTRLFEILHAAGFSVPETRATPPQDAERHAAVWLRKPFRSAGGAGIARYVDSGQEVEGAYFQRHIAGEPRSVLYCGDTTGCRVLGSTWQLVGADWLGARDFAWCGNVGPCSWQEPASAELARLGELVWREFDLRGLFGIDVIADTAGRRFTVLEINPRYCGSVEIVELTSGIPALAAHAGAFEDRRPAPLAATVAPGIVGKAILYVPRSVEHPVQLEVDVPEATSSPWDIPSIADVPAQPAAPGAPLVTVFALAETRERCIVELRRRARDLYERLVTEC